MIFVASGITIIGRDGNVKAVCVLRLPVRDQIIVSQGRLSRPWFAQPLLLSFVRRATGFNFLSSSFIVFSMRMFQVHTLALLLSFTSIVFAIPRPSSTAGQSIALRRRSTALRTEKEWALWAKNQREVLMTKYSVAKPQRRSSGTNLFVPNF